MCASCASCVCGTAGARTNFRHILERSGVCRKDTRNNGTFIRLSIGVVAGQCVGEELSRCRRHRRCSVPFPWTLGHGNRNGACVCGKGRWFPCKSGSSSLFLATVEHPIAPRHVSLHTRYNSIQAHSWTALQLRSLVVRSKKCSLVS